MTQGMAIAATLFAATFVCTAWAQEQTADSGCDDVFPDGKAEPSPRIHATWVKDAEGKSHWVLSPVKELKVARLIFVGQPALPLSMQDQIAKSLSSEDRNDDGEAQEELVERLRDAWQQQGYFRPEVKLSGIQVLSEDADSKTVAITVNIAAGKQYRLDEIRFTTDVFNSGNRSAPLGPAEAGGQFPARELRKFFPINESDLFDTHKIQVGIEELRKAYGARGFINMSVVPTFELDEKNNRITLNLEIEEGKQYRIGEVKVVGYDPPALHLLLMKFEIVPSVVFDTSQLSGLNDDIQTLLPGRFKLEEDLDRPIHEDRGTVDLIFNIKPCAAPR